MVKTSEINHFSVDRFSKSLVIFVDGSVTKTMPKIKIKDMKK